MGKGSLSLKRLLKDDDLPRLDGDGKSEAKAGLQRLQLRMLRIQQGVWHRKSRAIVVFEGFDAAGKGGAIRRLTEDLDPRGIRVHPIGPPSADEQGIHYLYRFWQKLPRPGTIAIFDRSWYGRVLVERVEGLCPRKRWRAAYREIRELERMLIDDGVDLVKIFLAISPEEQLRRFKERLEDPYKQWKLAEDDVLARERWDSYVEAVDDMFRKTQGKGACWHLIPADDKHYARQCTLATVVEELGHHAEWMESKVSERRARSLEEQLLELEKSRALRRKKA